MHLPAIAAPSPEDAEAWFDFLVEQQAIAYAGVVRPDFVDVHRQFRDDWVAGLRSAFGGDGEGNYAVAKVGDAIVGLASTVAAPQQWEIDNGFVPSPTDRELERLYVHADFHGTGLAQRLLDAVDDGRDLYLWLIAGNTRAERFYARRGFVSLAERQSTGSNWGGVPMHRMARIRTR